MFQEGKVYVDRFNSLYCCQNGILHMGIDLDISSEQQIHIVIKILQTLVVQYKRFVCILLIFVILFRGVFPYFYSYHCSNDDTSTKYYCPYIITL